MKHILFIFGILLSGLLSLSGCKKTEYPDINVAYSVGQQRGGGVVVYVDAGGTHGLISNEYDLSSGETWAEAVTLCNDYSVGYSDPIYNDWRLPTAAELQNIYTATYNNSSVNFTSTLYWTSTEANSTQVTVVSMGTGNSYTYNKTNSIINVRAVRAF